MHIDVNEGYPLALKDNTDFTVVAGDVAGDPKEAIDWIRQNVQRGLVVSGNHLVYNGSGKTVPELKQQLAEAFPADGPITYLDQMMGTMHKVIDNILFIGTTLYTDYDLRPTKTQEEKEFYRHFAMQRAMHLREGMRDFKYGYINEGGKRRQINPMDYRRWFIESQKEMTRLLAAYPDKEAVVVTHHCPHPKCCSESQFRDTQLDASYASDMTDFIMKHPNIRLWITGHVHERKSIRVGNCLIVMNPRGYECFGETLNYSPNVFVNTQDWRLYQEPFKCLSWENQRRKEWEKIRNNPAMALFL